MRLKPKDVVSTKPGVIPWRFCEEIEKIEPFGTIAGELFNNIIFVRGIPYAESELTLELPWVE